MTSHEQSYIEGYNDAIEDFYSESASTRLKQMGLEDRIRSLKNDATRDIVRAQQMIQKKSGTGIGEKSKISTINHAINNLHGDERRCKVLIDKCTSIGEDQYLPQLKNLYVRLHKTSQMLERTYDSIYAYPNTKARR